MLKIVPPTSATLPDYWPERPRERGIFTQRVRTDAEDDTLELFAPSRDTQLRTGLSVGAALPSVLMEHRPSVLRFPPILPASVLPADISHAPFAAAVGALVGAQASAQGQTGPDLGRHLSVVAAFSHGNLVAAAFFRRSEEAGEAHRLPVVVLDSLPVVGEAHSYMAYASGDGGHDATYPLLQKAYAQLLRTDARAPQWDPAAATAPHDTTTAVSTAHALFSLTGCEPSVVTVRADAPASERAERAQALLLTLKNTRNPVVFIPHGPTSEDADAQLPCLRIGEHRLVAGMPISVANALASGKTLTPGAKANGLQLMDYMRLNAGTYAYPTAQQVRAKDDAEARPHLFSADEQQAQRKTLAFPEHYAKTVAPLGEPFALSLEALKSMSYTTVTVPLLEPHAAQQRNLAFDAAQERDLAVFEAAVPVLARGPLSHLTHDAKQNLSRLLAESQWKLAVGAELPCASLEHRGRPLLVLTRDNVSRMYWNGTDPKPQPLLDHLLALPGALPVND